MVSFGKNNKSTARRRYRYDELSTADKEIADVLLTQKNEAPLAAALVEPDSHKGDEIIYELVVEDKNTAANEAADAASLNEQVAQLCREYEAVNQRLEKSLIASSELSKQLEKSKKIVAASYIALGVAGFAVLLGIASVAVGISMQRDVDDLRNSIASLVSQTAVVKKESALKTQQLDGQIAQMNEKIDKVFASDNLGSVLQTTKELRKQVQALADKNLAIISSHNHSGSEPAKVNKISLPGVKPELPSDKKQTSLLAQKSLLAAKVDAEKKTQYGKLVAGSNFAVVESEAGWVVDFGTVKDKTAAKNVVNKLKKAGVSSDIMPVKLKKQLRYRVVSKAFKNKQEAQQQADQLEKTLSLHANVLTKAK